MKKDILLSFATLILLAMIIPGCDPPRPDGTGANIWLPGTYKLRGCYAFDTAGGSLFYKLTDSLKADIIIVNKDFTYHQTRPDTSAPFIPPFATDGKIDFSTSPAYIDNQKIQINAWDASGFQYKYQAMFRGQPVYITVDLSKQ